MKLFLTVVSILFLVLAVVGCQKALDPLSSNYAPEDSGMGELPLAACPNIYTPPPSGLVTVSLGQNALEFWPFTGNNFSGEPADPINIIFFGNADPRDIRAALLSLDGDRTGMGMPAMPPFNSIWDDAIGDVQAGYGTGAGWAGSCVQLACGDYQQMRFHLRLFKVGKWTIANAHLDLLIPHTTDHQVISWEVAEQFVIADFIRSGLLDPNMPMVPTAQINPAPFRTIPAIIYNGMPPELRMLIGGPTGDVTEDVPILTDGHAVILNLAGKVPRVPETRVQDFVINFDQVIPKPFCPTTDYIYVNGPVHLVQTTRLAADGTFEMNFQADGQVMVVTVDPQTGQPISAPMAGVIREEHSAKIIGSYFSAISMKSQKLGNLPEPGSGQYSNRLIVRSNGLNGYQEAVRCGTQPGPVASAPGP
jgi:hypothetical protein